MSPQKTKSDSVRNETIFLIFTFFVVTGTLLLASMDSPTGLFAQDFKEVQTQIINESYTENSEIMLDLEDIERISITGTYKAQKGETAKIYAETQEGTKLLIAEITIEETTATPSLITGMATQQQGRSEDNPSQDNKPEITTEEIIIEEPLEETIQEESSEEIIQEEQIQTTQTEPITEETINETTNEAVNETLNESVDEEVVVDDVVEEVVVDEITNETINETTNESVNETLNESVDEITNETINETTNESVNETLNESVVDETVNETVNETTNETVDEPINDTTENESTNETNGGAELLIKEFNDECHQTCVLQNVNITKITIELESGELFLEKINYIKKLENLGEGIKKEVPSITLEIGENHTFNANEYFEEEGLFYDAKSSEGYSYDVNDNEITFTAKKQGTWDSLLYATDGESLFVSNSFNITISGETEVIDEENESEEEPIDEEPIEQPTPINETTVNETITENETIGNETMGNETMGNETLIGNETITNETTQNITDVIGCDYPDPNKRPLECIQHENTTYFQEEDLIIENTRGEKVARFTPIGNLLLTGDFIENSKEEPNSYDYQLGYVNNYGEFIATVWINTDTGDLHLKGLLIEANANIVHNLGKSAISNKRGILLAVVDRQTGDMKMRGNVVPYRRSLS